ncbi:hypothetical protein GF325_18420 [Candidatus Bathyarchaeota archaeon]|nr:hypothetical protein [Candidatus Bathyarchaeota archaeon]
MAYTNLSDDDKELYLDVLKEGTTPFDRFVSRGDVEDMVDIPNPRREMDRAVMSAIRSTENDKTARFIPVLGSAGSGKTHAFWALKDKETKLERKSWTVIYVPSPPAAVRILFHIYTCIIDEIPDIIDRVADTLVEKFGGKKKKFGFFGKADIDEVIAKAASEYPGVFADCIKAIITYGMHGDKTKRDFAKRWLLGEAIEEEELEDLGIQSVIERDDVCLAMIKLISENLMVECDGEEDKPPENKVMVLYFDEFESPYRTYGAEAEIRFIETLKRMYNEVQNIVIVAAILKDIWERLLEVADPPFRSRMEPEVELKPFSFGDVKLWFAKSMEQFWTDNNLVSPIDPIFPINEKVLRIIFNRTHGNPRETIKLTRVFVDKIIYGDLTLEEITDETKPSEIESKIDLPEITSKMQESTEKKIDDIIDREGLIFDINPASIVGAMMKGLQEIALVQKPELDQLNVKLEFNYFVGGKEKSIAGYYEDGDLKVGIDVPSVKTFDRSGGVAAYYSAKRLVDGLTNNTFNKAVIIIPEATKGQKTQYLFENNEALVPFRINQQQAEYLIQTALNPDLELSKEIFEFARIVSGWDITIPEPPAEETGEETSEEGQVGDGGIENSEGAGDEQAHDHEDEI